MSTPTDQPRTPAGSPQGGQFATKPGGGEAAMGLTPPVAADPWSGKHVRTAATVQNANRRATNITNLTPPRREMVIRDPHPIMDLTPHPDEVFDIDFHGMRQHVGGETVTFDTVDTMCALYEETEYGDLSLLDVGSSVEFDDVVLSVDSAHQATMVFPTVDHATATVTFEGVSSPRNTLLVGLGRMVETLDRWRERSSTW